MITTILFTAILLMAGVTLGFILFTKSTAFIDRVTQCILVIFIFYTLFTVVCSYIYPSLSYLDKASPLCWIFGSCGYIRFKATERTGWSKQDIWHLLPMVLMLPFYFLFVSSASFRTDYGYIYYSILYTCTAGIWFVYALAIIFNLGRKTETSVDSNAYLDYISVILLFILAFFMMLVAYNYIVYKQDAVSSLSGLLLFFAMFIAVSAAYLHYFYLLMHQQRGVSEIVRRADKGMQDIYPDEQERKLWIQRIDEYLVPERYLDMRFNMLKLSKNLKIPKEQLLLIFEQHYGQSFITYVNQLRVRYACSMLADQRFNLSMEQLAADCGFRSKASFYRCFRDEQSCTPLMFRERKLKSQLV
ncbi:MULTISPECIES: helix-turn-helix domain-containing protein [Sphingobacterium]|uniref:helix-turn-helix domain-containing protein n=1 Tax=Sphingobacterium TaxID=28453 RepID=UPI0019198A76|nr:MULTISPECIES: helix-turn-helix domain-containing protein [Sphingobacterium]QQT26386.1 AraC family transcriptional regulator [Sphingobacterium spiritivorum]